MAGAGVTRLVDRVIEQAADLESTKVDLGPGLRKGLVVFPEFDCFDGCMHGSERCLGRGSPGFHGYAGRTLFFYVCVPGRGGVAFDFHAPFWLPQSEERNASRRRPPHADDWEPIGPVSLHIAEPADEGTFLSRNEPARDEGCIITCQSHCWFDCTYMQADTGACALADGGIEGVWSWLAEAWLPDAIARMA